MDIDAGQPRPLAESTRASIDEAAALAARWHGAEGGRLRYAFAPRFALSCTEELFRSVAALGRERDLRVHTHASENRDECRIVRERTGRDNVDWFHAIGIAEGGRLCLAHCVHVSDAEVAAMAASGTKVLHCPSSNLKLASGIAPVPEMRARGVSVSLGADGAPCNNNLDMFREMRLAALVHKPRCGPRAMPAREVLAMATVEGARALGLEREVGRIEPGMRADLAVLDLDRDVATTPGDDVYARIVYAAGAHHVDTVVVDGRAVVRGRRLLTLDEERVRARAREEVRNVEKRIGRT